MEEKSKGAFSAHLKSGGHCTHFLNLIKIQAGCLLLNYVSLKHKSVGFESYKLVYFHTAWENVF